MCSEWLDVETKTELARNPPDKLAPATIGGYTLVLLERGKDHWRVADVLATLCDDRTKLSKKCPLVLRTGMSYEGVLQAQFELICCDSISVFIDDGVFLGASADYLLQLFAKLRASPEFELVSIQLDSVPARDRGMKFLKQFLGMPRQLPFKAAFTRKKARIMKHWAERIGAALSIGEL
jgi:hypothetical protein